VSISSPPDDAPEIEDRPEIASDLLDLRDKPPEPLAPSPQALGVWELAWPTIIAGAMQTMVRWVDLKMVGDLGIEAVAGVAAGGQVYWLIQSIVMAVTTGLVALVARAVGSRDDALADSALRQGIVLGCVFGAASLAVSLPFTAWAIAIYGVEQGVVDYGSEYLAWLLLGNIPFTLTFVFGAALRAAGDVRTPLYVGLFANVLNVFLNWVLIYGHLGAPALGVTGAALASSSAMLFQVVVFWILWRRSSLILRPGSANFAPDLVMWRRLMRIGYPAALEGALWHVGLLLFLRIMSVYGTEAFTAYQIGAQILSLAFLPGSGFAMAASTLVGQHLGDRQPDRAAASAWRSLRGAILSMTLLGAILIALSEPLARWFLDDEHVVRLTSDFIWVLGAVQPLMAIEFTLGGALRGAGDTRFPLFTIFFGLMICRVIPAAILAYVFHAPVQVVWCALILDYLVKGALLIWRFRRGVWRRIEV
jgi:putative MATE family efflux protein